VSPAAVSYALRGTTSKVSPVTRAKIESVAAKLGYQRDRQASAIMGRFRSSKARGAAGTIAVIHPAGTFATVPSNSSIHTIFPAIKTRAQALNYAIDLIDDDKTFAEGGRLQQILQARAIQGIIVLNARHHIDRLSFDISGFHAVAIGYSVGQAIYRVCPNQYEDMMQILERLRAFGHRRPALLMYRDLDHRTNYRYTGALLAHYRCVLGKSRVPIYLGAPDSRRFRAWLKKEKPDALIMEEQTFFPEWLLEQLNAIGLQVPRDVGLVSFDIWKRPRMRPLAGIMQNWTELGSRAVEMLVGQIYHGSPPTEDLTIDHVELVRSTWSDGWSVIKKK
jgi:DNA-binding LacI/PurR family transcriptional regulator